MRAKPRLPPAERLRELLDYDPQTGALLWRISRGKIKAGELAGHNKLSFGSYEHKSVTVEGRVYPAARVIWKIMTGEDPIGRVEHLNGNRRDLRWKNLTLHRPDPDGACRFNRPPSGLSGFLGVYRYGTKWIARLRGADSRLRTLGTFETKEQAARAIEEWRQRKES